MRVTRKYKSQEDKIMESYETQWLRFSKLDATKLLGAEAKTEVWMVSTKGSLDDMAALASDTTSTTTNQLPAIKLGLIKWHSPWRRYWFEYPQGCYNQQGLDSACLADIKAHIDRLMLERKEANGKKAKPIPKPCQDVINRRRMDPRKQPGKGPRRCRSKCPKCIGTQAGQKCELPEGHQGDHRHKRQLPSNDHHWPWGDDMKVERLDKWDMTPVRLLLTAEDADDVYTIKQVQAQLTMKVFKPGDELPHPSKVKSYRARDTFQAVQMDKAFAVITGKGKIEKGQPGDWLVRSPMGCLFVMEQKHFEALYVEVSQ
jgi:hypothetical protein